MQIADAGPIGKRFWHEAGHFIDDLTGTSTTDEYIDAELCDMAQLTKFEVWRAGVEDVVEDRRGGRIFGIDAARRERFSLLFKEFQFGGERCSRIFAHTAAYVGRLRDALRQELNSRIDLRDVLPEQRRRGKIVLAFPQPAPAL